MPASTYGGTVLAALLAVAGGLEAVAADRGSPASPEIVLALGETTSVGQVKAICAGSEAELISASTDPASGSSLHLALVDYGGNFVAGAPIMIDGQNLTQRMHVRCRGDWLLLEMKPGPYTVIAEAGRGTRKRTVQVPKDGRLRVAMTVPDV